MTAICFIGAGSVEFTRDLTADILSFPELSAAELRLHDIDEVRLDTAAAGGGIRRAAIGRNSEGQHAPRPAGRRCRAPTS